MLHLSKFGLNSLLTDPEGIRRKPVILHEPTAWKRLALRLTAAGYESVAHIDHRFDLQSENGELCT